MELLSRLFSGAGHSNPANLSAAAYKQQYVQNNQAHALVDVRSPQEFASGHVTGALNLPVQELSQRLAELPRNKPIMLYCRSGNRSGMAVQVLQGAGFGDVYNVGSLNSLLDQGLPLNRSVPR